MKNIDVVKVSKSVAWIALAFLLFAITGAVIHLSEAGVEVLTNPDYSCTPVEVNTDLP